ncbi:MAG: NADH-quinone oxidoreductase subunit NuoE [Bacillota bacterium]|jgi:NADH-quinone oxidoreductase subunit E
MGEDRMQAKEGTEKLIGKYPADRHFLLAMMQDVQKEFNYLPKESLGLIARYINLPVARVYSMATFYKAFSLVPKGRYCIKVCDGTACHIKGSNVLIDQIYQLLKIKPGETTSDGEFSLETVNCLGACAIAPVMLVNGKVHAKVTSGSLEEIINQYRGADDECNKAG